APFLIVLRRVLYTFSGSRDRITSSENTLAPKSWRIGTFLGGTRVASPLLFFAAIAATAFWRAVARSMGKRTPARTEGMLRLRAQPSTAAPRAAALNRNRVRAAAPGRPVVSTARPGGGRLAHGSRYMGVTVLRSAPVPRSRPRRRPGGSPRRPSAVRQTGAPG